jgi:MFS family permease
MSQLFFTWLDRYRSAFQHKAYIYLLGVAFLSLTGDLMASVATIWVLTTQTDHSALYVTTTIILTQASFAIASPFMGHIIDKFGPLQALIGATLVRIIIITLLFICVTYLDNGLSPWFLVLLLTLDNAVAPIYRSGEFVMTQILVPEKDLNAANALQGIQFDLAFILGPILGGILADTIGLLAALIVNIFSFVLYGSVILWLKNRTSCSFLKEVTVAEEKEESIGLFASLKQGIQFLKKKAPLPWLVAMGFFWNLLILGPTGVIFPILANDHLKTGALGYGLLMSANSAGFTMGLVIIGGIKWKWPLAFSSVVSIGVLGLLYIFAGLTQHLIIVSAILFIGGLITAPTDVFSKRIRQKLVPVKFQGRITSVSSSLGFIGGPLGTLLIGGILQLIGNQWAGIVLSICGFLLFLISSFIATRPFIKSV